MNILYINHYAGAPAYGMEYRPYYLAREWVRTGHRVTVVAASESHVRSQQPAIRRSFTRESIDGIDYLWCATPGYHGNGVTRVLNIAAFLRRLSQWPQWLSDRPDVVIASSTYPADVGFARRIARHHGATLVWEVHDLWPLSPIELGGMSRRHPFIVWMQRAEDAACRDAELVISMLPKADLHLTERGMATRKFAYVPNGIDPDEWSSESIARLPRKHARAIESARDRGHLLVGYAGAHGLANALGTVLDAAALAREARVSWLLVGGGPDKPELQRRVTAERLNNVLMLDPVPRAAIPALLRAMDVLYVGLRSEPLFRFGVSPNKLMDYMMAARPVVCGIRAGNDPVGESGCGYTIAPEDPSALVTALDRMRALSPDERDRLGRAGREYVQRNHLYPVLAQNFLSEVERRRAARS